MSNSDLNSYELINLDKKTDKCSHASMLNDAYLLKNIEKSLTKENDVDDSIKNKTKLDDYNAEVKDAFKRLNLKIDTYNFEQECNSKLRTKVNVN